MSVFNFFNWEKNEKKPIGTDEYSGQGLKNVASIYSILGHWPRDESRERGVSNAFNCTYSNDWLWWQRAVKKSERFFFDPPKDNRNC